MIARDAAQRGRLSSMTAPTRMRVLDYCLRNDNAEAAVIALACGTSKRYVRSLNRDGYLLGIRKAKQRTVYTVTPAGLCCLEQAVMARGVA